MISLLGWVARRRVAVLAATLPAAVVGQVLQQTVENDRVWTLILAFNTLLPITLMLSSVVAVRAYHPAMLVARPGLPAFEVPANPGVVLGAAGYTFLGATSLGILMRDMAVAESLWFAAGLVAVWIGLLILYWLSALGRFGVRLRPDGIVDRQMFGSLFVPWEALATPYPAYNYDPLPGTPRADP